MNKKNVALNFLTIMFCLNSIVFSGCSNNNAFEKGTKIKKSIHTDKKYTVGET